MNGVAEGNTHANIFIYENETGNDENTLTHSEDDRFKSGRAAALKRTLTAAPNVVSHISGGRWVCGWGLNNTT